MSSEPALLFESAYTAQKAFRQPIVHIKGFASRIDYESAENKGFLDTFVKAIVESKPGTIAWDGDNYGPDSYTVAVPRVLEEYKRRGAPAPDLLIFKYEQEQDVAGFRDGWERELSTAGQRARVLLVDRDKALTQEFKDKDAAKEGLEQWEIKYVALGLQGLRITTDSQKDDAYPLSRILFLGGGLVPAAELRLRQRVQGHRECWLLLASRPRTGGGVAPGERETITAAPADDIHWLGPQNLEIHLEGRCNGCCSSGS